MRVKLLSHTNDPEKIVAAAARCCYSNDDPDNLLESLTDDRVEKFLSKLVEMKHESPFEHASFTFSISGVSRALLAQITRHRVASFSVRSQRYCEFKDADFVLPDSISRDPRASEIYLESLKNLKSTYDSLLEFGISKEDSRMILPNAAETSMVLTMNARELLHFFSLRCCSRAQWEIRAVANEMLKLVKNVAPNLFRRAGANCIRLGYCPEGKMSCGKFPTLEQILNDFNERKSNQ